MKLPRGSMRDTVAATVFFDRMTGFQDFVDGVPERELPRGIMCDAVAATALLAADFADWRG
ncbi:MAG: hypothetical protein GX174_01765 [Lentisphaerae bacterium]|nr:hypothetical protein [Lentisphaerota bacterium]